MDLLWNISMLLALSSVYVASIKTKLEELITKDMTNTDVQDTSKNTDKIENVNEILNKLLQVHIKTDNSKQLQDNIDKIDRNLDTIDNRQYSSNDMDISQNINIGTASSHNKDREQNDTNTDKVQGIRIEHAEYTCQLSQTMAWAECGHQVNCPSTCQGQNDCTFPYCNSKRICACRNALCRDDKMCHFYRIACAATFECRDGHCFCNAVEKITTKNE